MRSLHGVLPAAWAALAAVLLAGCLTAGPGACDSDERAALNDVPHFEDLSLEAVDHPWGICTARFTTEADPQAVIAHYEAQLSGRDWEVVPQGPAIPRDHPDFREVLAVSAQKGIFQYTVEIELLGTEESTVVLLVGKSG